MSPQSIRCRVALCCHALAACVLVSPAVLAQKHSWPQWRGPDRTDVSRETQLLKEWPAGGPRRVWLFRDCGIGYSGPAIVDDRIYIMGSRDDVEQLLCIDAKQGTEIWAVDIGEKLENKWGDGPRGTPSVDQGHVYALGAQGNLICARASDGTVVWKASMIELGGELPNWGYTESPLVDGNRVLCTPGGEQGAVVAFEKRTGAVLWKSVDFQDSAQYASIIAIDHNGKHQYVQLTQQHVVGLDAENGSVLWTSEWPGRTAVIPTPIFSQGKVYVTSGYGVGCKLVSLDANHEVTEVYANKHMKNHHGGVVLVEGHLFGYSDNVGWVCQNFESGEISWRDKEVLGKGCVTYADGMLYCVSEGDGTVCLAKANTEAWQEHGRFVLEPQTELRKPSGKIWTHPVVVNGRLYLRDQELLFCFDVSAN